MKVMVVGAGAREHVLAVCLKRHARVEKVVVAGGNAGMSQEGFTCFPLRANEVEAIADKALKEQVDLVVIGPEEPLSLGLADLLRARNISVLGPGKKGAKLEASKIFCKKLLFRYGIPTASCRVFEDYQAARRYLKEPQRHFPLVVKADGLAAGKGVYVCDNLEESLKHIKSLLKDKSLGEAGARVLIETFLKGEELSAMLFVNEHSHVLCPLSQDYKRVGQGDCGPNTGGMGACAPVGKSHGALCVYLEDKIIAPLLRALRAESIDFQGVLYLGLMADTLSGQAHVVEINVRLGDPECQVVVPLVENIGDILIACAEGKSMPTARLKASCCVNVVLAAEGYPEAPQKGTAFTLPDQLPKDCFIYHASTSLDEDGNLVVQGGRVLSVLALGKSFQAASLKAYQAIESLRVPHTFYRKDIGHRQAAFDPLV